MPQHSVFTAAQLMEMAVRIEDHGRAFYEACLSEPVGGTSRELFQYLLDQEREHARLFSRMEEAAGMKTLERRSDADQVERVLAEEHDHVRRLLAFRREIEASGRGEKPS